jgi:BolA protein
MTTAAEIRKRLATLQPTLIEIADDSALHAGHAGAAAGGGHFRLTIVSPLFAGKRTIERHRMVYDALGTMMRQQIHAMSISAMSPEETP